MIEEKFGLVLIWLAVLVMICGLAFALQLPRFRAARGVASVPAGVTAALYIATVLSVLVFIFKDVQLGFKPSFFMASPPVLALVFLVPFIIRKEFSIALGGFAAVALLAPVNWWAPEIHLKFASGLVFIGLGLGAVTLIQKPMRGMGLPKILIICGMPAIGLFSALWMAPLSAPQGFMMLWHHWGAYVAPVQALIAGGIPFHDFPVQYGLGPTVLIAALGHGDPWFGLYLATACANALYLLTLSVCLYFLLEKAPRGLALVVLLALLCAVLLWTGFPPYEMGPMVTPSTGGMRFLPLAALMMLILYGEHKGQKPLLLGYACWLFSFAWSPEAGIYATIVWFPYIGLYAAQARGVNTASSILLAMMRGGAVAGGALIAGMSLLAVLFWLIFGQWPELAGFFTYILNPPGMISPNPFGPVGLVLCASAVAMAAMTVANAKDIRIIMTCLLAFGAVSSYYVGRSHDNNILNLFPFFVLVLACILRVPLTQTLQGFVRLVLVGLVAWPATFGFGGWTFAFAHGHGAELGPATILNNIRFKTPEPWALSEQDVTKPHSPFHDLGAALIWFEGLDTPPPLILDVMKIMPRSAATGAWTGVNNLANFGLLPPAIVTKFIQNSARTFHRAGWIVMDRTQPDDELKLFLASYTITQERVFGGYTAYRLEPK